MSFAILILPVLALGADPTNADILAIREEYATESGKIAKAVDEENAALRTRYLKRWEDLRQRFSANGNALQVAVVKTEMDKLRKGEVDAPPPATMPRGKWDVEQMVGDLRKPQVETARTYVFEGSKAKWLKGNKTVDYALLANGHLLGRRADGEYERWLPLGDGRFLVEWFHRDEAKPWGHGIASPAP